MHSFKKSLELSHSYSDAEWWEVVYRKAFSNFDSMTDCRENGWWQAGGIDRVIHLKNSKSVFIDEKVRTSDYPDILLERWSDKDRRTPGWIQKDLACDYIAYAFVKSATCYLLDFRLLRRVWLENGREWINRFPPVIANNGNYKTESIPIPTNVLLNALQNALTVKWSLDVSDENESEYHFWNSWRK